MRTIGMIQSEVPEKADVFACPHCGKEYKTESALKTHCKKEHPEQFDNSDTDK